LTIIAQPKTKVAKSITKKLEIKPNVKKDIPKTKLISNVIANNTNTPDVNILERCPPCNPRSTSFSSTSTPVLDISSTVTPTTIYCPTATIIYQKCFTYSDICHSANFPNLFSIFVSSCASKDALAISESTSNLISYIGSLINVNCIDIRTNDFISSLYAPLYTVNPGLCQEAINIYSNFQVNYCN